MRKKLSYSIEAYDPDGMCIGSFVDFLHFHSCMESYLSSIKQDAFSGSITYTNSSIPPFSCSFIARIDRDHDGIIPLFTMKYIHN